MRTSLAGSWKAAAACTAAGAGVAGDVVHMRLEMKAQLELDDSTACENGDHYDMRTCDGRVVALRGCQRRAVHGVYEVDPAMGDLRLGFAAWPL
eukprot:6510668-Prymnesium_polylepis.2